MGKVICSSFCSDYLTKEELHTFTLLGMFFFSHFEEQPGEMYFLAMPSSYHKESASCGLYNK